MTNANTTEPNPTKRTIGSMDNTTGNEGRRCLRMTRTAAQRDRRRERECGSWTCPLCTHPPFTSISGLLGHVALAQHQNCTRTGNVAPFVNADQERRLLDAVRKGRRHDYRHQPAVSSTDGPEPPTGVPAPSDAVVPPAISDSRLGMCRVMSSERRTADNITVEQDADAFPEADADAEDLEAWVDAVLDSRLLTANHPHPSVRTTPSPGYPQE